MNRSQLRRSNIQRSHQAGVCSGRAVLVCAMALFLGGSTVSHAMQDATSTGDFDRRILIAAPVPDPTADALPTPPASSNDALDAFAESRPDLAYSVDATTGVTTRIYDRLGYLTAVDTGNPIDIALDFLSDNLQVLGLDPRDLEEYELRDVVPNQATGSTHIYLRQRHSGVPVYNGLLHLNINRAGRILGINNAWVRALADVAGSAVPGLTASSAVERAGQSVTLQVLDSPSIVREEEGPTQLTQIAAPGLSTEPVNASLMWLPIGGGDVRLVWNFQIYRPEDEHVYDMTVDANSSEIWTRFDWIADDSYRVYPPPSESPLSGSSVPPADGRVLVHDPSDPTASPQGWHDVDGVPGAEYTTMRGNNVHAYVDDDADDSPPSSEPDCGAVLDSLNKRDLYS